MTKRKSVGVLISGRGSNLKSLIDASTAETYPAEISIVLSNRQDAPGLDHARAAGIPAVVVDHTAFETREAFEEVLDAELQSAGVDLVCNAGFMRLLTDQFVTKWLNRHLNIHPSLLPAYKGLHTHERVLKDGVKITGCTVHYVRTDMDSGPIIAQAAVAVHRDDTSEELAARVLEAEHRIYPLALELAAGDRLRVSGDQVIVADEAASDDKLFVPPLA